jgi:hypothetical protein
VPDGSGPRPSQDVAFRELEGETVLVHLGTNRIYSLNPTGARFWELLAAGVDVSDIKAQLLREFDVEGEQLESEIEALLTSLASEGLVTVERHG